MVHSRRILTLAIFLLSFVCGSFGDTKSTCSWGTWSHWNCACCGNSEDQPVYRVRTQCCPGTYACGYLRIMAEKITSIGTDFKEKGQCLNDCSRTDFKRPISNRCSSVVPTINQTLLLAKPNLCHSVCIGSLSTTTSLPPSRPQPPETIVTHRGSTRVTASSAFIPPYTSHHIVPAKNVTTRPNAGNYRSLTTTKSSERPNTTDTHRGLTRSITTRRRSTIAPPNLSHNTVNDTTRSEKNLACRFTFSSCLVLWIPVVFTAVLCLLDLIPT